MEQDDLYASEKPKNVETGNLNIRLPLKLRDDFANLCKSRGIETAKVIRRFIERELEKSKIAE